MNNFTNYSNERVDELILKARGEADFEERDAMLDEVQTMVMDELAYLPIVERKTLLAMQDSVCCYYYYPHNSIMWKHLDYVK